MLDAPPLWLYNASNKLLTKTSIRRRFFIESRERWNRGRVRFGEWTSEGGANGKRQLAADGVPAVIREGA